MIEKTKLPWRHLWRTAPPSGGISPPTKGSSIYFGAVLRSESETIEIGEDTNIQDNCVLHTDTGFP